ncbi:hypothetical protein [Microvirga thermotolerans]|uniref:Uncharacterized protein n=1 Tax=Microvirga thermotolerans TaxID=2651334 RepID=A0A5P9JU51_9HYPH|nr:hypothetical protein [Microvirga thermotolerans]QFU15651.1 hypothetical protein GDR74_05160 [Microvirga thermotolerans]
MKKLAVVAGLALPTVGCAYPPQGALVMSCSDYIGRPISEPIRAYGAPQTVVRISPTEVGYSFVTKTTTYSGGDVWYTTNYMVGVDTHRAPVYATTTACRGTFITRAPSDVVPVEERIVVDVWN